MSKLPYMDSFLSIDLIFGITFPIVNNMILYNIKFVYFIYFVQARFDATL